MTDNAKKGLAGIIVSGPLSGSPRPANPPPAPPAPPKTAEAIRQERHRLKLEELGVKVVEVELGPIQRLMLEAARVERGGLGGAYSVREYVATLLRRDFDLLEQQRGDLAGKVCGNCRKPLPRGCGGVWSGEASCLRAQADQFLAL